MLAAVTAFLSYLGVAVVLLAVFIYIYAKATPYKEFQLIAHDKLRRPSPLPVLRWDLPRR